MPELCLVGDDDAQYEASVEMMRRRGGPFILWRPWRWEVWFDGRRVAEASHLTRLEAELGARGWKFSDSLRRLWEHAAAIYADGEHAE